jgi:hypothetical protein
MFKLGEISLSRLGFSIPNLEFRGDKPKDCIAESFSLKQIG